MWHGTVTSYPFNGNINLITRSHILTRSKANFSDRKIRENMLTENNIYLRIFQSTRGNHKGSSTG